MARTLTSLRSLLRRTALVLLPALVTSLAGCGDDGVETVRIGGETFQLEIANDPDARAKGLMHRAEIPDDGGMLFIFPQAAPQEFWMAYCEVDIDVMYLDARGRVTATYTMAARPPRAPDETEAVYFARLRRDRYPSRYPAQYVIELPAGTNERLGIEFGDRIDIDLDRLRTAAPQ